MILLLLALLGPIQHPRLGIDTTSAKILAASWVAGDNAPACAYGKFVPAENAILVDSVSFGPCGPTSIGVIGFSHTADVQQALPALTETPQQNPSKMLIGLVHAVTRIHDNGSWMTAPLIWAALRTPTPPLSPTSKA